MGMRSSSFVFFLGRGALSFVGTRNTAIRVQLLGLPALNSTFEGIGSLPSRSPQPWVKQNGVLRLEIELRNNGVNRCSDMTRYCDNTLYFTVLVFNIKIPLSRTAATAARRKLLTIVFTFSHILPARPPPFCFFCFRHVRGFLWGYCGKVENSANARVNRGPDKRCH